MTQRQHTIGQRIKAAMDLGGYDSLDRLAEAANLTNLSGKTLRRSSLDRRDPGDHELEAIARVCGLPVEFFTVDFSRLPEIAEPADEELGEVDQLREELREMRRSVEKLSQRIDGDLERAVRDATRSITAGIVDRLGGDPPAAEPAPDTHDAGDANPAAPPAQSEGTR